MNHRTRVAAIAAALFSYAACAQAQGIQWKQVINVPKGLNMPQGVSADILGIQLGDTYAEAKAKMTTIGKQSKAPAKLVENSLSVVAQGVTTATRLSFVNKLELTYRPDRNSSERLLVQLSAPSSGHQVIAVDRYIRYEKPESHVRIDALLASLKAKYKAEPLVSGSLIAFQFDNGKSVVPVNGGTCPAEATMVRFMDKLAAAGANRRGDCDVALQIQITQGISPQHAQALAFNLSDNERVKQNYSADYAFIKGESRQIEQQRQQLQGAPGPKL